MPPPVIPSHHNSSSHHHSLSNINSSSVLSGGHLISLDRKPYRTSHLDRPESVTGGPMVRAVSAPVLPSSLAARHLPLTVSDELLSPPQTRQGHIINNNTLPSSHKTTTTTTSKLKEKLGAQHVDSLVKEIEVLTALLDTAEREKSMQRSELQRLRNQMLPTKLGATVTVPKGVPASQGSGDLGGVGGSQSLACCPWGPRACWWP